ncbi:MAG: multidrug RND transporter [Candidatus Neomarinimicrobiota bacterium]|nr:MAG: multidrug RND transporter [Candidatus Neomarinimicrobiota bacterium]
MRKKILTHIAEFTSQSPWWMLGIILVITIGFALLAERLEFSTSITNLMPQDDPMVKEFDRIMEEYAGAASMMVVAEGDPETLPVFANTVAPRIMDQKQYVKKVDYKLPRDYYDHHALMLMKSSDLDNTGDLFTDPNLTGFLTHLNDSFEKEYIQSDEKISGQEQEEGVLRLLDGIQSFTDILTAAVDAPRPGQGEAAAEAVLVGDEYYRSWDREMLIMQILPDFSWLDVDKDVAATDTIEAIVKAAAEQTGVQAGLTGIIPLSRDETMSVMNDSWTYTIVAILLIFLLFILSFRMIISPFLSILALILGIIWAMGLSWILVGKLNLMTSMMGVVLAGLGIDFSIHIIASYTEMRQRGEDVAAALRFTLAKTGQGIITGGLTTAAAFLTMVISNNSGMKEFGLVLGTGIIMTMVAALVVLPTLLVLRERLLGRAGRKDRPARDVSYRRLGQTADTLARYWRWGLAGSILITLFMAWRAGQITMDYNYLNMEPVGLESVKLQNHMIDKLNLSSDYSFITAPTLEEAYDLTRRAKKMSTAGMVRSIADFLPPESEQRRRSRRVEEIRAAMEQAQVRKDFSAGEYQTLVREIDRLEMNIIEIQDMAVLGGQDKVYLKTGLLVGVVPEEEDTTLQHLQRELSAKMPDITRGKLSVLREKMDALTPAQKENLLSFQQEFAPAFQSKVLAMANPEPLTIASLPESIRNQFVGKSGKDFLITVFPKNNVWELRFLKHLSQDLEQLSPRATGMPPVFYRLMGYIAVDGRRSSLLAVLLIFLLLIVDFGSWRKALLALSPLLVGMIWMVGTMELVGYQLTLLNIMALPLIIGIGIDDGVHIVHRYNVEGNDAHRGVFASTGRAILLTSLTTMIGFGSFRYAAYRGMGSMGMALFIGVGTCFVATVWLIPVLMGWWQRRNGSGAQGGNPDQS